MKKIIAFSLWGNDPKYNLGSIRNAEIAKILYPDWVCRFYVGKYVNRSIITQLENIAEVKIMGVGNWTSTLWRFQAIPESDIFLSRDCDSRLSIREKSAVDEWLASDKDCHIMRDHPWHDIEIMAGMWGVRGTVLDNIQDLIKSFNLIQHKQCDQIFLRDIVHPIIKENSLVHDEITILKDDNCRKFPIPRQDLEFVGDVFNSNNNRTREFKQVLERHLACN